MILIERLKILVPWTLAAKYIFEANVLLNVAAVPEIQ
jgi:hypothetical protein